MATKVEIQEAQEARKLGEELIAQFHPHLAEAKVLYLFTSQKREDRGRRKLGSAQKLNPLQRYLSSDGASVADGYDFLLLFGLAEWDALTGPQRRALVDHELAHCSMTDGGEWTMAPHDLQEFTAIVARHGLWKPDVHEFATVAARQLELFEEEAGEMLAAIKAL